jgi:hypothetical protein
MYASKKQASFNPKRGSFHTALRSRFRRRRTRILLLGILFLTVLDFWWSDEPIWIRLLPGSPSAQIKTGGHRFGSTNEIVSCVGPRGKRIRESPNDRITFHSLGGMYFTQMPTKVLM